MEDSNTNPAMNSSPINDSPSPTGRRSGGPRTAEGKRRSCQNAHKHGLYTDESFLEGAALELGEDPRQFQRLLKGLIEARRPVGALEMALVEDIALVLCKKARADRSELAVQVSNLHQHDLERRKQMIQVGHANSEASEWDVREHGLRRAISSPGQYEQVLNLLGSLLAMIDINEFDRMKEAMRTLYGTEHTLRGAEMDTLRYKLSRTKPEDESFQPAKKAMMRLVAEECAAVEREYEIFLQGHVTNTRAARVAATAPSHAQWAAIIRQQNALHRQLERKIRLLDEMQERRRKMGSATNLLSKLAGVRSRLDEPDGGGPAPTTPNPSSSEEGSRFDPAPATSNPSGAPCAAVAARHGVPLPESVTNEAGVAHTSRCSVSGCMRLSPESRPDRVADMPNGGTSAPPPDVGAVREPPVPESATDVPPAPAENTQNRGNEAKKSLKTNDWAKIECAIRMPFSTQKVPNDAKNVSFRCAVGFATRAIEM